MRMARLLSLLVGIVMLVAVGSASAQTPATPPPAPPPAYGAPITLDQAKKLLAGAEAEAKKNNWGMVIVRPDVGQDEGISVRCTRVFLLPAEGP